MTTDEFVTADVIVPNIRQDMLHVTIEIHSDAQIEKTKEIHNISYEQATRCVHGDNTSQEAELNQPDEPGPSGQAYGIRGQKIKIFSE